VEDFLTLDQHLKEIKANPMIDLNHFWSEQTYYALMAARFPKSRAFSEVYSNSVGTTTGRQIVRHYVGIPKVRFRYFTEGLPRITEPVGLRRGQ
jgi:hypothetical protein